MSEVIAGREEALPSERFSLIRLFRAGSYLTSTATNLPSN
jgi:hypothetical protein